VGPRPALDKTIFHMEDEKGVDIMKLFELWANLARHHDMDELWEEEEEDYELARLLNAVFSESANVVYRFSVSVWIY